MYKHVQSSSQVQESIVDIKEENKKVGHAIGLFMIYLAVSLRGVGANVTKIMEITNLNIYYSNTQ